MAIPTKDSLLIPWAQNFDAKATASPVTYNLNAAQATAFHAAFLPYQTAYNAVATAREAGSRSKLLTQNKDTAKANFLRTARELYGYVQDSTTVTVANKLDIGVNPKNTLPSPVPPPDSAPDIDVISASGNTVKLRLHDASSSRRAKPPGVEGASVFAFVGATPPGDLSGWAFQGNSTKTLVDVAFPASTPAGARVWFTAVWFNQRMQTGPSAAPVGTNIPGGSAMAA